MSRKKQDRAKAAARGTAADPTRTATADAERLRSEARESVKGSSKLVGVMPEKMAEEVMRTGTYPFTFKSAFILAGAALLGAIVIPFFGSQAGVSVGLSTTVSLPVLIALALSFTRYFIDSDRGLTRGCIITFLACFAALSVICWLLFFQGIMI